MNQTQAEFNSHQAGQTQNDKLELHFKAHPNEWLELPDLVQIMGGFAVHSRVSDLRKERGMNIEHKNTWATEEGNGKVFSRYRFIPEFHPNLDGPAEPIGLAMQPFQAESIKALEDPAITHIEIAPPAVSLAAFFSK